MTSTLINHSKPGKRVRRNAQQWREILDRQQASGLSQAAFCKQENLASATFYNWQNRLGAGSRVKPHAKLPSPTGAQVLRHELPSPFIRVGTVQSEEVPGPMTVRLDLGAGIILEISRP